MPHNRLSHTLGALLGLHAGDSLGATLEFLPWSQIQTLHPTGLRSIIGGGPFSWTPGHATDDTDLTRAVLLSYLDYENWWNSSDSKAPGASFDITKSCADHSLSWLEGRWPDRDPGSGPRDIGGATYTGLANYQKSGDPRKCGAGNGRAGNGSLMRCVPTALFVYDVKSTTTEERKRRVRESMEISSITHNDVRCTVACAAYNEIVAALVGGMEVVKAVGEGKRVADELDCPAVFKAIEKGEATSVVRLAKYGPGDEFPDQTSGFVLQSLTLAVAAVLDVRPLEDVLVDVVRIGGDTDTNGAIAGGLLGARDGVEKIPKKWLEKLQFREEFETAAKRILELQGRL
ncbi:ADP-ribosylation/Crystallin J1 [Clohesyomyces aquaticus]|uniref:ADP-ribosylhydrolase ARH3 n=1 Tax=Clohesyomyces aquaticus TaxID=1231657 RepID=A0A1Y1YR07_9PLEO|nr:ADP-ribosylation/Crystallin J1 [Clohesyomyces aquaticus]